VSKRSSEPGQNRNSDGGAGGGSKRDSGQNDDQATDMLTHEDATRRQDQTSTGDVDGNKLESEVDATRRGMGYREDVGEEEGKVVVLLHGVSMTMDMWAEYA
jgi:hypothetical protein